MAKKTNTLSGHKLAKSFGGEQHGRLLACQSYEENERRHVRVFVNVCVCGWVGGGGCRRDKLVLLNEFGVF